jgi:hypothetical protein
MADAKSENQEIRKMGGVPQPNSGRGKYRKGDAVLGPFIVDVKEAKSSFTYNKKVWAKVCSDAAKHLKEPALMTAIGEGDETVRTWIIGDVMFHQMLECWMAKYGQ